VPDASPGGPIGTRDRIGTQWRSLFVTPTRAVGAVADSLVAATRVFVGGRPRWATSLVRCDVDTAGGVERSPRGVSDVGCGSGLGRVNVTLSVSSAGFLTSPRCDIAGCSRQVPSRFPGRNLPRRRQPFRVGGDRSNPPGRVAPYHMLPRRRPVSNGAIHPRDEPARRPIRSPSDRGEGRRRRARDT
jgi:hypothetical protein